MPKLFIIDLKFLKFYFFINHNSNNYLLIFFKLKNYYKKIFIKHTLILIPKFFINIIFMVDFKVVEIITLL